MRMEKQRLVRIGALGVGLVVFLFFYVEDWGRDFTSHSATVSADNSRTYLRPLLATQRTAPEMEAAARMAASRIGNWRGNGNSVDGNTTSLIFVRTNRILRIKDDITIRLQNRGDGWALTGESTSRWAIGDLGRNRRNLNRFLLELQAVGVGSTRRPVLDDPRWSFQ
jgi:hypothetical protein